MRKWWLLFSVLCCGMPSSWAGQRFNPFTGKPDLCSSVQEEDGSPSLAACPTLKFANGNLTDNGDGTVSVADQTGAGGGDPVLVNTTAVADAAGVDLTTGTSVSVTLNAAVSPDTATFDVVDDSIAATELADADFGDFSCADGGGGCLIDANAVALGTDTTGGYAASTTEAGGATSLEADGVDALTEIAQGIKTAAEDTSPLVVGTAGSTGEIASWGATGALSDNNVILGTMTDGKWCSYATAGTLLSCTQNAPAGSGDITSVGDVADGAAFDGTQGTTLTFNNAGGDKTLDYDGTDFLFNAPLSIDATDGADVGALRLDNNEAIAWEAAPAGTDCTLLTDASEVLTSSCVFTATGGVTIDATTEGNIETAADIGGEVTSTGMASTVIADSVTVTGWVLGTSSATTFTAGTVNIDLLDGVGAVDMDYGSADVTDHTFTTDGTGTAEIVLPEGAIDSTEILNNTIGDGDLATTESINLPVYSAKLTGAFVVFTPTGGDACTAGAQIDAGDGNWRLLFDATTDECATWQIRLPDYWAAHSQLNLVFSAASATANEVQWEAGIMCITPDSDNADIGTASFATIAESSAMTVAASAGRPYNAPITLTDDSCAAGDMMFVVVSTDANDATNDDATGDRELVGLEYEFTR